MSKFERQSRYPADDEALPEALASELAELPTQGLSDQVMAIPDAPSIAPRPPLTPSEVRTILMSLLLTMFLAALDQTIVATRAADHRPPVPRRLEPVLGHHRLSAGLDRGCARVRDAERHLWPPAHDHHGAEPVRGGLRALRAGAEHGGADSSRARCRGSAAAESCRWCRP